MAFLGRHAGGLIDMERTQRHPFAPYSFLLRPLLAGVALCCRGGCWDGTLARGAYPRADGCRCCAGGGG